MIARIWKGVVRTADADHYAGYIRSTGFAEYAETVGNRGAWMLRRDEEGSTEFITLSFWESIEAIRAFAGDDIEAAVLYPEDERYLLGESTVTHYEVADHAESRGHVAAAAPTLESNDQPGFELTPIGRVESPLLDPGSAPKQGDEGAPDAWLAFHPAVLDGLDGIRVGDEVIVITWLHRARRDELRVHPRGDVSRAQQGVFSTRSPHRPNPIGLHRVEVASIDGDRVHVRNLEAVDGTPIIDMKPVLSSDVRER
jgi:tRNA-Thr(GGU) m(6)t(6)A37 methyltransferase TsaA